MARSPKETQEEPPVRHNRAGVIGADARAASAAAFARMGFADPSLVLRWREIAGPEVARIAQPLKFTDSPGGGILTLRTAPGAALFLGHEKRPLCERINTFLGRTAVTQIKFSQGSLPSPPATASPQKKSGPLSPADPSCRYRGPDELAKALQALARRR